MPTPETMVGFDGSLSDTYLVVMVCRPDGRWQTESATGPASDWVAEQVAGIFERNRAEPVTPGTPRSDQIADWDRQRAGPGDE
jgi:hypothetical protein